MACLTFLAAPLTWSGDFHDTTTGTGNSQIKPLGNQLSAEDEAKLERGARDQLRKFRKGRASSSVDQASRYSGILEMHDADYDGVSDHDNSANDLEGGMEKVAVGRPGTSGVFRKNALEKSKAEACKNRDDGCEAISGVIVDRGSAHGGPNEPHRVYEVAEEAKKNARAAGESYGRRTITEASTKKGSVTSNADIDLLRTEAAWLEDQKERNLQNGWKFLRAKRLIGSIPGYQPTFDINVAELVSRVYRSGDPKDAARQDAEFVREASRIINERARSTDPNYRPPQDAEKTLEKIQSCMGQNKWCNKGLEDLPSKGQDPGNAYTDTRELIYHQSSIAQRAPLNRQIDVMRNMDFSQATDSKTGAKIFSEFQKDVANAQRDAQLFQQDTAFCGGLANDALRAECERRRQKPGQNGVARKPALAEGYDPRSKSVRELNNWGDSRNSTFGYRGPATGNPKGSAPSNSSRSNNAPSNPVPVPNAGPSQGITPPF